MLWVGIHTLKKKLRKRGAQTAMRLKSSHIISLKGGWWVPLIPSRYLITLKKKHYWLAVQYNQLWRRKCRGNSRDAQFYVCPNQVIPEDMVEEQKWDSILRLVCQYVTARKKLKTLAISKIKSKDVQNISCNLTDWHLSKGVLHWIVHQQWCRIPSDESSYKMPSAVASNVAWWPRSSRNG